MHVFRKGLLFSARFAILLTSSPAAAFDAPLAPHLVLRLPLGMSLPDRSASEHTQLSTRCHLNGGDVERIERSTSDPCLASESVPGGVCFARLGLDPVSADFDEPHDWQRHCGA
jgi:hypothetical protein